MTMAKPSEASAEGAEAPKKSKKMLFIALGAVLVLGGGGFGYWKFKAAPAQGEVKKTAVFLDLPDILVNLASTPGTERQNVLKLKLSVELSDPKMLAQVQPLTPRLLDTFQTYLRELKASDLEGSAGFYRLKEELLRRTNAAVHPVRIEALLFKDVLVQ